MRSPRGLPPNNPPKLTPLRGGLNSGTETTQRLTCSVVNSKHTKAPYGACYSIGFSFWNRNIIIIACRME